MKTPITRLFDFISYQQENYPQKNAMSTKKTMFGNPFLQMNLLNKPMLLVEPY